MLISPVTGLTPVIDFRYVQGDRGCSRIGYRTMGIAAAYNGRAYETGITAGWNPTRFRLHFGKISSGSNLYPVFLVQAGLFNDKRPEGAGADFYFRTGLGLHYVSNLQKPICILAAAEAGYSRRMEDVPEPFNGFFCSVKAGIGINFERLAEIREFKTLRNIGQLGIMKIDKKKRKW